MQVEKGSTAAVFGLGTIGLAVVDALQEAGARMIIGVDTDEGKFHGQRSGARLTSSTPRSMTSPFR